MPNRIDLVTLNASVERFLASTVRNIVTEAEALGVADHPAMTCIPGLRAYLKRYDAAYAQAASEQADPQSAPHLRLVG
jgi:hypothetical protein